MKRADFRLWTAVPALPCVLVAAKLVSLSALAGQAVEAFEHRNSPALSAVAA